VCVAPAKPDLAPVVAPVVALVARVFDTALRRHAGPRSTVAVALMETLEQATAAIARLDQALDQHPLRAAFLHRARLDAVRRQAAVDGQSIDPWHLAAVIEGLRLRMDGALRIVDCGVIFEAARTAFRLYQWITAPDFDQEGEVQAAARHLESTGPGILLGAADGLWSWLERGGTRPPIRAALIRRWTGRDLLRAPVPLTGARALHADAPADPDAWTAAFLAAIAAEAADYHQLLRELERGWRSARAKVAGRRSNSRAGLAVDVLAATPLLSATTLARATAMSIKSATELLDGFVAEAIVVEVTHRSARRLFGLSGMAPVRDVTAPPRRPEPGRGRGRPRLGLGLEAAAAAEPPAPLPPVSRFERPAIDYSALEAAMAHCDAMIRSTRQTLDLQAKSRAIEPIWDDVSGGKS